MTQTTDRCPHCGSDRKDVYSVQDNNVCLWGRHHPWHDAKSESIPAAERERIEKQISTAIGYRSPGRLLTYAIEAVYVKEQAEQRAAKAHDYAQTYLTLALRDKGRAESAEQSLAQARLSLHELEHSYVGTDQIDAMRKLRAALSAPQEIKSDADCEIA